MSRASTRVRMLLSLIVATATLSFVVPAAASAGEVNWDLRASWVSYVNRWGGSTTAVSPGRFASPTLTLPQAATGSGNVAPYDGGFNSRIALHGVNVLIEDISIDFNSGAVTGSGHYTPLLSRSITFSNQQLFTLRGGTKSTATNPKTWEEAVPALTRFGATVFNGGSNGSYAEGAEFGLLTAEGDF